MIINKIALGVTVSILILAVILFFILNSFIHVELDDLNGTGEYQVTFLSPNKDYKADLFLINKGGATNGYQERVSITSLSDSKKEFNDTTIYWLYPSENVTSIEWESNTDIVINGGKININDEDTYYNWKKDDN